MLPAVGHCLVGAFFLAKVLMSWGRVACLLPQGRHNHSEWEAQRHFTICSAFHSSFLIALGLKVPSSGFHGI